MSCSEWDVPHPKADRMDNASNSVKREILFIDQKYGLFVIFPIFADK